jgi:small subunit ribosomal protein S1
MEPMSDTSIPQTSVETPSTKPEPGAPAPIAHGDVNREKPSGPGRGSPPKRLSGADLVASLAGKDDPSLNAALEEAMRGLSDEEKVGDPGAVLNAAEPANDSVVTGRIANIGSQDVLIDFGGKSLGTMTKNDFDKDEEFKVGDSLEVAIVGQDERSGLLSVSRKKARQIAILRDIKPGMIMSGVVTGMNKGGLEISIEGLRGFIPASQVDVHFVKDISEFLGKTVHAEVSKFDAGEESIILSRRKYQAHEQEKNKEEVYTKLVVGQIVRGKVKGLAEFGAFVDIGGADGLLHISDMSWGRVTKPEEVVKVGDEVEVKIIKLSREKQKISLSLKQATPNPWGHAGDKYKVGEKVQGRVMRMQNFGAFVELEPGIEALLPVSEMSWTKRVRSPGEVLKEGDVIEVGILAIDLEKKRISLSLKALGEDPWAAAAEKYTSGSMIKGKVVRTTEFGAFVALEDGIDGLIHISELDDKHVKVVTDKVKVGQEVEVRVLGVNTVEKRISLSMRKPSPAPTPEELAKIAAERAAAAKVALKKKEKAQSRRGGITIEWDQGLGGLDPSKFARN